MPRGVAGLKLPGASTIASAAAVPAVRQPHACLGSIATASPRTVSIPAVGEQLGQIVAVEHARREILGCAAAAALVEPAGEMVGIVGKSAHPPRRHVEQMLGPVGRISDAASGRARALDQGDPLGAGPGEVQRLQRARGPAADHRDAGPGHSASRSNGSATRTGSARLSPSRIRAVSSRTISMARWSRHLSSLMQFLHFS